MRPTQRLLAALALIASCFFCGCGSDDDAAAPVWTAAWAAAPYELREARQYADLTIRQIMRTTIGGQRVRVRISNRLSEDQIELAAVSLARSVDGALTTERPLPVLFNGDPTVTLAAGESRLSDPVAISVAPLTELALSFYLLDSTEIGTAHGTALRNAFFAPGNQTLQESLTDAFPNMGWWLLSGLEVEADPQPQVVVALGDSITDGFGAREVDGSWPERMAARVGGRYAVLNAGIDGNRILREGNPAFGPSALNRFDFDVLQQAGASVVVILEGINDLQAPAVPQVFRDNPPSPRVDSEDLIAGFRQLIRRARDAGLMVVGGTLLPYVTLDRLIEDGERERTAFNDWVRTSDELDAFIDFDAATRDPADPQRLLPEYDSGDGLHPSDAGYQAMADAAFAVLDPLLQSGS